VAKQNTMQNSVLTRSDLYGSREVLTQLQLLLYSLKFHKHICCKVLENYQNGKVGHTLNGNTFAIIYARRFFHSKSLLIVPRYPDPYMMKLSFSGSHV